MRRLYYMLSMAALVSLFAAFAAGWAATLAVHQPVVGLLHHLGIVASQPYGMRPTAPFGVPHIWSLAFWSGVWGVVLVLAERRQRLLPFALFALVFGAIAPTLVAWFVVAPLHGQPVAAGWNLERLWIGPFVNGLWGLGAALFWRGLAR
jgi:hypothetical protein